MKDLKNLYRIEFYKQIYPRQRVGVLPILVSQLMLNLYLEYISDSALQTHTIQAILLEDQEHKHISRKYICFSIQIHF